MGSFTPPTERLSSLAAAGVGDVCGVAVGVDTV